MSRFARRLVLVLAAAGLALGACAGGPDDGGPGGGPGGGGPGGGGPDVGGPGGGGPGGGPGRRPLPNVFVSPAGEPFRADAKAPYPSAAWFARANTSHDGKLTRAQFDADFMAFFRTLDENHDGVVDGLEVQDYEQKVAPEILPRIEDLRANEGMNTDLAFGDPNNTENRPSRQARGSDAGRQKIGDARDVGVQGAGVYSFLNIPEPVASADETFDSRITAKEFLDAANRRFDLLDKTGVGYLTLAALPKTPVQKLIDARRKAEAKRRRDHPGSEPRANGPEGPPVGAS